MKKSKGTELATRDTKEVKRKSWSKRVEINGMNKSLNVEELDNGGYLVTYNYYGKDKKDQWIDKTKKYYSDENPLEEAEEMDIISELSSMLKRKE